jgi:hypothetical protein
MHRNTFMYPGHALFASVFYYCLLLSDSDLNVEEIFLLELKGRAEAVWVSIAVNTLSSHLRAEDAELRMELRLPALQEKVFRTSKKLKCI